MKSAISLAIVTTVFALPANGISAAEGQTDNPQKAIEQANAEFGRTFAQGDASAIAGLYTEKARLLPPNADVIEGRSAIEAFWKGVMDAGVKDIELKSVEVEAFGDTIVEQGTATLYGKDKAVLDRGKYIVVWKRVDKKWKLHRDCWNTSEPAPTK